MDRRGENWRGTAGELRMFKNLSDWQGEVSHRPMDLEEKPALTELMERDLVGFRVESAEGRGVSWRGREGGKG